MRQENYDFLKNQVKFTGFGEGLDKELKAKMEEGQPSFTLQHGTEYGTDKVSSTLHFRKSEEKDMYYFNKYELSLQKGDNETSQFFHVGKDNTFTHKEAYNLLDGRAVNKNMVNKEGDEYNSWIKLDFNDADANGNFKMKHFHENYGYDVVEALSKHDIKELRDSTDKERLISSLKKGNRQSVTFFRDGEERKGFVEANPKYKSVKLSDEHGAEIRHTAGQSEKKEEQPSAKRNAKQNVGEEGAPTGNKQKKSRGAKIS